MQKQRELFGCIRYNGPTFTEAMSEFLSAANIVGIDQPFEMLLVRDLNYKRLIDLSNIRQVAPQIQKGPKRVHQLTSAFAWYRFIRVTAATSSIGISEVLKGSAFRNTYAEEGISLTQKFPQFPNQKYIWILDGGFQEQHGGLALTLGLRFTDKGWCLDLGRPYLGAISRDDLILVHCNFK